MIHYDIGFRKRKTRESKNHAGHIKSVWLSGDSRTTMVKQIRVWSAGSCLDRLSGDARTTMVENEAEEKSRNLIHAGMKEGQDATDLKTVKNYHVTAGLA